MWPLTPATWPSCSGLIPRSIRSDLRRPAAKRSRFTRVSLGICELKSSDLALCQVRWLYAYLVDETERRAEIARRLKAARWLAGGCRTKNGGNGVEPVALTAEELADRQPLKSNGITAYRIGTIERMEHHTPPMELDAIADALGVARRYFRPEDQAPVLPVTGEASSSEIADLLRTQNQILQDIRTATSDNRAAAGDLKAAMRRAAGDFRSRALPQEPQVEPTEDPQSSS